MGAGKEGEKTGGGGVKEHTLLAITSPIRKNTRDVCARRTRLARAVPDTVREITAGAEAHGAGLAIVDRGAAQTGALVDHVCYTCLLYSFWLLCWPWNAGRRTRLLARGPKLVLAQRTREEMRMTYTTSWQVRQTLRCDAADQDSEGGEVRLHVAELMFDLCGSRHTDQPGR